MPKTNVASVQNYDFGAPVALATVLKFRVKKPGDLDIRLELVDAVNDMAIVGAVSDDDVTYTTTTVNDNRAIINETVQAKCSQSWNIGLRAEKDLYLRFQASGGARGQLQIRGSAQLEIVTI